MIFYALYAHITGKTIQGWTSLLVSLWFIGGIVTTSIGVTGIYIGKIYTEAKHRPRYFIQDKIVSTTKIIQVKFIIKTFTL